MKKLLLGLIFLMNFILIKAQVDKIGLKSVYWCPQSKSFSRFNCVHVDSLQVFLLEEIKILKDEFNRNEPRALHNYSEGLKSYIIKGEIKSLDSGVFDNEYIIVLEDKTSITVKPTKEEQEKYFELNKGDIVHLIAYSPKMHFGDLQFVEGSIIEKEFFDEFKKQIIEKY